MPILNVKVCAERSTQLTRTISDTLINLTTTILNKNPNVTVVLVEYIHPEDWSVGGESLAAQNKKGFYMDIKITDETNTKAEKAEYIKAVFEAFSQILGDIHEESYVYVQDVRATAYGYGGETQEYRYQQR